MKLLKGLLLVIFLFTLVGVGTYVAYQRGLIDTVPFLAQLLTTTQEPSLALGIAPLNEGDRNNLEQAFTQASTQLQTLGQRTAQSAETSSQVLGDFIQINETEHEKPASQKALEYGRYLYCQQVVQEWEKP